MASRLSISRSDIASLWTAVAAHRDRAGDPEGAATARWQSKQWRTKLPEPYNRREFRR